MCCLVVLEDDPYAGKLLHGPLKEHLSLGVGDLRALYTISDKDKVICVVAIGPRRTVYK